MGGWPSRPQRALTGPHAWKEVGKPPAYWASCKGVTHIVASWAEQAASDRPCASSCTAVRAPASPAVWSSPKETEVFASAACAPKCAIEEWVA
jgi:hypothetical protein